MFYKLTGYINTDYLKYYYLLSTNACIYTTPRLHHQGKKTINVNTQTLIILMDIL